jgi:hypothetical protein
VRTFAVRIGALAVGLALFSITLKASGVELTDAQIDGLYGPVRETSTRLSGNQVNWQEPGGFLLAETAYPGECEYDEDSNRIKSGQTVAGEFQGAYFHIIRDKTGRVTERIAENYKGEVESRELLGPYGKTEQDVYQGGKLTSHATWTYEGDGRISEYHCHDGTGSEIESSNKISDASGNFTENWEYGQDGTFILHSLESYDPARDISDFISFNEDGTVKVTSRTQGNKVLAYWEQPGENQPFGSHFYLDAVGKTQLSYSCHPNGTCDPTITYFLDEARYNPSRTEQYDAAGELQRAAYYKYDLDQFGNWTKRTLWVWTPELGERKLYETAERTIKYWTKE